MRFGASYIVKLDRAQDKNRGVYWQRGGSAGEKERRDFTSAEYVILRGNTRRVVMNNIEVT